jgi:hypothetical protein
MIVTEAGSDRMRTSWFDGLIRGMGPAAPVTAGVWRVNGK